MHAMPYLIKNSAHVWCVQRKVPERLQAAVARILGGKKPTQAYLKKSLGTKDRREATRRYFEKLATLKAPDEAMQLTTDHMKSAYETFVAEAKKIGEMYKTFFATAFKPSAH